MGDTTENDAPEGYDSYEPSVSAFPNHIGRIFRKKVTNAAGEREHWIALQIEPHHVNAWNLGHGGLLAALCEIVSSGPGYEPGAAPVVAIEMSIQFIKAPKLGDLVEAVGVVTRRTRSVVFTYAKGFVGKDLIFTVQAVHKVVGA